MTTPHRLPAPTGATPPPVFPARSAAAPARSAAAPARSAAVTARSAAVLLAELRRRGITATTSRDETGRRWLQLRGPLHPTIVDAVRPYIRDLIDALTEPWLDGEDAESPPDEPSHRGGGAR